MNAITKWNPEIVEVIESDLEALKDLERLNRSPIEITQKNVVDLLEWMNQYDNAPITPVILEAVLLGDYSLTHTNCDKHPNKHWEYVHVLSLLNESNQHVTYIELRCKPHVKANDNRIYMKSWGQNFDIEHMWIIEQELLKVSTFVYLPNKGNETLRGSWV